MLHAGPSHCRLRDATTAVAVVLTAVRVDGELLSLGFGTGLIVVAGTAAIDRELLSCGSITKGRHRLDLAPEGHEVVKDAGGGGGCCGPTTRGEGGTRRRTWIWSSKAACALPWIHHTRSAPYALNPCGPCSLR